MIERVSKDTFHISSFALIKITHLIHNKYTSIQNCSVQWNTQYNYKVYVVTIHLSNSYEYAKNLAIIRQGWRGLVAGIRVECSLKLDSRT